MKLRREADLVVRIPMRPGISSLNLATSVAVALYSLPGTLHATS
ncbi:MAG: TrmH family RNA methyltransferase [Nitriliruptorales bacterium]